MKLSFIFDRIATAESMTVTEAEVVQQLWQLAQRWRKDPVEVRHTLDAQGLWPSVLSTIRREKTRALLMGAAQIEDVNHQSHT